MKSEEEVKKFLEDLKKQGNSSSSNMNYELHGALDALEWALDIKVVKPVIGRR